MYSKGLSFTNRCHQCMTILLKTQNQSFTMSSDDKGGVIWLF